MRERHVALGHISTCLGKEDISTRTGTALGTRPRRTCSCCCGAGTVCVPAQRKPGQEQHMDDDNNNSNDMSQPFSIIMTVFCAVVHGFLITSSGTTSNGHILPRVLVPRTRWTAACHGPRGSSPTTEPRPVARGRSTSFAQTATSAGTSATPAGSSAAAGRASCSAASLIAPSTTTPRVYVSWEWRPDTASLNGEGGGEEGGGG